MSAAQPGGPQILDFEHEIDGGGGQALCMPAGGSLRPASHETVDRRLAEALDGVLLASVGAGFTVGAVLLRWGF